MAVLTVGPHSAYPSIAAAMAAANPGDTIQIESGYGNEAAVLTVDNLIVSGDATSTGIGLTLGPTIADVTLQGTAPISVIDNDGNNTITGNAGDNVVMVTQGVDNVDGGAGNDRLIVEYSNTTVGLNVTLLPGTVDGNRGVVGDLATHVVNFDNIDSFDIRTGSGNDVITTGSGDDAIHVHAGTDVVAADAGNDRLYVDYSNATDDITSQPLLGDLLTGFFGGYSDQALILGDSVSFQGIETFDITTGSGNDSIVTGDGNDIIRTGAGSDTLSAGGGNDNLNGGVGADNMSGGAGQDAYFIDNPLDVINEGIGEGSDLALSTVNYTLNSGAEVETLSAMNPAASGALDLGGNEFANVVIGNMGINTLSGGGENDVVTALSGNDTLNGDAGDDVLDGGAGDDTMAGGIGNDWYLVGSQNDLITEAAGQGADRVFASVSYFLRPGVEAEVMSTMNHAGLASIDLTGNELSNIIYGNAADNTLTGGDGDDTLVGLDGDDTIIGGNDNDSLYGEDGADTINGGAGADRLYGGLGQNSLTGGDGDDWYIVQNGSDVITERSGEGTLDRLFADVSYTLTDGAFVELLSTTNNAGTAAINLTGNVLANTIYGNEGANVLTGGDGDDTLVGLGGDDTLNGNEGNDVLNGENGNDTLDGGNGDDRLVGGFGNDQLIGGSGQNSLTGGTGDDWYFVSGPTNTIVESSGGGMADRVFASDDYALTAGAQVELMSTNSHAGTGAIDLTGNELANTVFGNEGTNVLSGLAGDDLLYGLGGDDVLAGGTGADRLVGGAGGDAFAYSAAGEGGDMIDDFLSGTDTLRFTAAAFGFSPGHALANGTEFIASAAPVATAAGPTFLMETDTHQLYFDSDGSGALGPTLIATLHANAVATDLVLV